MRFCIYILQPTPVQEELPTTSTHHNPVMSAHEEEAEVDAFLGHLRCTMRRIPTDARMELQADILAMVYARYRENRQSGIQPRRTGSFPVLGGPAVADNCGIDGWMR